MIISWPDAKNGSNDEFPSIFKFIALNIICSFKPINIFETVCQNS